MKAALCRKTNVFDRYADDDDDDDDHNPKPHMLVMIKMTLRRLCFMWPGLPLKSSCKSSIKGSF